MNLIYNKVKLIILDYFIIKDFIISSRIKMTLTK